MPARFSPKKKALTDIITILCVIFYLGVMVAGGISSSNYAIVYNQKNYTAWAPVLWPIKTLMTLGVFLLHRIGTAQQIIGRENEL